MRTRVGPQSAFVDALYVTDISRKYKMVVGVRFRMM